MDMNRKALIEDITTEETSKLQGEENNPPMQESIEPQVTQEEPLTSLHALVVISTPQTLELMGYIKHWKVIVLIDSVSTHNFNHKRVAKETHCYDYLVHNFQIMIGNGGVMKCDGRCENVTL